MKRGAAELLGRGDMLGGELWMKTVINAEEEVHFSQLRDYCQP